MKLFNRISRCNKNFSYDGNFAKVHINAMASKAIVVSKYLLFEMVLSQKLTIQPSCSPTSAVLSLNNLNTACREICFCCDSAICCLGFAFIRLILNQY